MKNNVNRKLEDENLEANGSSDVVAFGYSEMNEYMPPIRWKMSIPNEMGLNTSAEQKAAWRDLSLSEGISYLPFLRGARIEIEGDFE